MYLKSIKAVGFKSFADKTVIEFNKDITAVVGPNGSGKSNIVDAIRWVLGEQSVKQLRGASIMSDVIFSGSLNRDSQKKASVTLTFDNADHFLKSEFDEIEIRREVYKTGENDYFLNNAKVRLKDVRDLFLDSGAGMGAFNIISQGNVTEIVNSKAIDRRIIFESAAGVLKYKTRKEEAIKKLEKTKDNLSSIKLVIDELEKTVVPLKKQSDDARKYLNLKEKSKNIEIALITEDIEQYNNTLGSLNSELAVLNKSINSKTLDTEISKIEVKKLESIKLEDRISEINRDLISINDEISKLSSEKQITIERQRFSNKNIDMNNALIKLKEEESELFKKREILKSSYDELLNQSRELVVKIDDYSNDLVSLKIKKSVATANVENQSKSINILANKIDIAKNNLQNGDFYPKAVRSVINNPSVTGIIDTVSNLVQKKEIYSDALSASLASSANFVVTSDFESAKEAINFLKLNKFGKATFFPLDTIKSKYIKLDAISKISSDSDFIGIFSDLVEYDVKFKNIFENLLGNVLVVKTIEAANKLGRIINFKFKIVSLDGSIVHAGGAVSGGDTDRKEISGKSLLKSLERELTVSKNKLIDLAGDEKFVYDSYKEKDEMLELLSKKNILLYETINNKKMLLDEYAYSLENKALEIKGINNVAGNKLEAELINLIEVLTEKAKEKIALEQELKVVKDRRNDVFEAINTLENSYRAKLSENNKSSNLIKLREIEVGRIEVKLENLLVSLSDNYKITYELAREEYFLDMNKSDARDKLKSIKRDMDVLGIVNIGSIEQYEVLSERFNFLKSQELELKEASDNLLSIIDEMDGIMTQKFKKSFNDIASEFKLVFRKIFQGGRGELVLTSPNDLLNTGIEIIAEPPGKKLNNTLALSGGEKSLTAISLLFAILNVRPVPFIILDEAEAALDEANVDMFGKYINELKKDSQFILITHKKRMMEYADLLYGITMQESGVSKIVSTKLEV